MMILQFIKEHYDEIMEILNCIKVGVYIADGEGNTILLNDESEKTGGMKREQLVGENMKNLIQVGYVEESTILKAINSGKEESLIQVLGDGGQLYITGVPLNKQKKTELVVCTERDITETANLKELLKETEDKYKTKLALLQKENIRNQGKLVAESAEMKRVVKDAKRVAKLDATVLITGESGTGKELLANLLYENSNRESKPYIKVNCAAIPANLLESEFFGYEKGAFTGADKNGKIGIFELASGGTLFLDEIAELPLSMQPKLLRVLQEREITRIGGKSPLPIDVRIIAATNVDLEKAIEEGAFREDLYYRLNIIPLTIPSLRDRKEDIRPMAVYFINAFNKQYGIEKEITAPALEVLEDYQWPGNIRQLRNVIERIMVSFDGRFIRSFQVYKQIAGKKDSPGEALQEEKGGSLEAIMEDYEKKVLLAALKKAGNASEAAKLLQVNKSTISRKFKKYHITE